MHCWGGASREEPARRLPGFRKGVHTRTPPRCSMVSSEGACAAYFTYRREVSHAA